MKFMTTKGFEGIVTVTILTEGLVRIAESSHPRFKDIVAKVESLRAAGHQFTVPADQETEFINLFDLRHAVEDQFKLTDRVVLKGEALYFDGNRVDSVLTDHVIRAIKNREAESSYLPFIRFWERVQSNPSEDSRKNLLRWLMAAEFTVTDEGFIIGYKGVTENLTSIHAGPGVVNGKAEDGNLDNSPGNIVEVARSYVTEDPNRHCAEGLHVGTWDYAQGFGKRVLEVWVDPIDVVSVPADSNGQKMRVCKYEVKRVLQSGYSFAVINSKSDYFKAHEEGAEVEDDFECDECGGDRDDGCSEDYCTNYCYECYEPERHCVCHY